MKLISALVLAYILFCGAMLLGTWFIEPSPAEHEQGLSIYAGRNLFTAYVAIAYLLLRDIWKNP